MTPAARRRVLGFLACVLQLCAGGTGPHVFSGGEQERSAARADGAVRDVVICVILALVFVALTAVWWELRHGVKHLEKSTQAQTTYTAVRGARAPRFLALPEHQQGSWPG